MRYVYKRQLSQSSAWRGLWKSVSTSSIMLPSQCDYKCELFRMFMFPSGSGRSNCAGKEHYGCFPRSKHIVFKRGEPKMTCVILAGSRRTRAKAEIDHTPDNLYPGTDDMQGQTLGLAHGTPSEKGNVSASLKCSQAAKRTGQKLAQVENLGSTLKPYAQDDDDRDDGDDDGCFTTEQKQTGVLAKVATTCSFAWRGSVG